MTQQLARWRAGPCSRPRPRLCAPSAAGGSGLQSAEPAPLWGRLAPAGWFPRRRSAVEAALRLDLEDGVGVQGPRAGVTGKTKDGEGEKFFSLVLLLEGPVGKHCALCLFLLCFCFFFPHQIMPKLGLKRVSSSHIPSKDLHTCPSSFPLIIREQDVQRL